MPGSSTDIPTLSFIAAVRGDGQQLRAWFRRLQVVVGDLGVSGEVVFVVDGSSPALDACREICDQTDYARMIHLGYPLGPTAATLAGLSAVRGRAVACCDTSGREPLCHLPALVARWREGFEVAMLARPQAAPAPPLQRLARLAAGLVRGVLSPRQGDRGLGLMVLDRAASEVLRTASIRSVDRTAIRRMGFRVIDVPTRSVNTDRTERCYRSGKPVGPQATLSYLLLSEPWRIATLAGLVLLAGTLLHGVLSLLLWPVGSLSLGWSIGVWSLFVAVSLQLLVIGRLARSLGDLRQRTAAWPAAIVRETAGFGRQAPRPDAGGKTPAVIREGDIKIYT